MGSVQHKKSNSSSSSFNKEMDITKCKSVKIRNGTKVVENYSINSYSSTKEQSNKESKKSSELKCFYTNARSIVNKVDELRCTLNRRSQIL